MVRFRCLKVEKVWVISGHYNQYDGYRTGQTGLYIQYDRQSANWSNDTMIQCYDIPR